MKHIPARLVAVATLLSLALPAMPAGATGLDLGLGASASTAADVSTHSAMSDG